MNNQQIPVEHLEQRSPTIVKIVVITISGLGTLALGTICTLAMLGKTVDPVIMTALISTMSTLLGALTGLLANTKTLPALSSNPAIASQQIQAMAPHNDSTVTVTTPDTTVTTSTPTDMTVGPTPPTPPEPTVVPPVVP